MVTRLSATTVEVIDGANVVARHERAVAKYAEVLVLDHYLEVLKVKPGALPGGHCAGPSQEGRRVHRDPSAILGRRPPGPWRRRRDQSADRGAARASHRADTGADHRDEHRSRQRPARPARRADRGPPPRSKNGRASDPDRSASPLRPARPVAGRLRRPVDREPPMTMSDTAA